MLETVFWFGISEVWTRGKAVGGEMEKRKGMFWRLVGYSRDGEGCLRDVDMVRRDGGSIGRSFIIGDGYG